MTFSLFGDSLLDTGNLTAILGQVSTTPFPAPLYNAGKASNGQVLGEATIANLGLDTAPDYSLIPRFTVATANPLAGNVNYAIAGATTDLLGSAGVGLATAQIGLQAQMAQFFQDLSTATVPTGQVDLDAIVAAGSNDIFEILTPGNLLSLLAVLATPSDQGEFQLSNDSLQFRSSSILPLTRNLANSAIVRSTISRLLETTLLFRLKRANQ